MTARPRSSDCTVSVAGTDAAASDTLALYARRALCSYCAHLYAPDEEAPVTLLDESVWQGRIHVDGGWSAGSGGEYDAVEPATGDTLASVGRATVDDVARAAQTAAEAQRDWAAAARTTGGRRCCGEPATCSSSTRTRSTSG